MEGISVGFLDVYLYGCIREGREREMSFMHVVVGLINYVIFVERKNGEIVCW